jgi:hypothetical protein
MGDEAHPHRYCDAAHVSCLVAWPANGDDGTEYRPDPAGRESHQQL